MNNIFDEYVVEWRANEEKQNNCLYMKYWCLLNYLLFSLWKQSVNNDGPQF